MILERLARHALTALAWTGGQPAHPPAGPTPRRGAPYSPVKPLTLDALANPWPTPPPPLPADTNTPAKPILFDQRDKCPCHPGLTSMPPEHDPEYETWIRPAWERRQRELTTSRRFAQYPTRSTK